MQWLVCNDSNSCMMYSYNWRWLAGRGFYWRSVESELSETLLSISGTQICHLPLIYALKGLETGGKVSNFTWGNVLSIHLFFFLSSSWVENKRGFMSPRLNKIDTPGQSHGHITGTTGNTNNQEAASIFWVFVQICFLTLFTDLNSWFHSNLVL